MDRIARLSVSSVFLFAVACGGGSDAPPVAKQEVPDTLAPTTSASPEGGDFAAEIEVVLTASEAATIHVAVDGGDFEPVGPSPVRLPMTEGVTTIKYYAVDLAGNVEAPAQSQRYFVDLSPPVVTLVAGDPEPLPWLATATIEWNTDEEADYSVTVVETGELLDEGKLDAGASAEIVVEGVELPDEPITIRIEATDWTARTSTREFALQRLEPTRIAMTEQPGDVVILPAGDRAFIARPFKSEIDVLDLDTEQIVETIDVGIRPWAVTLNADASLLYVSNTLSPGEIVTVDVDSYDVVSLSASVGVPGAVAFSPDGAWGFFTDFTGSIQVLDTDPTSSSYHTVVDSIVIHDDALSGRMVVGPQSDFLLLNWTGTQFVGAEQVDFGTTSPSVRTAWRSSVPAVNAQASAIALSTDGKQAYIGSIKLFCGLCRFDLEADELIHAGDDPDPVDDPTVTIGGKEVPDLPWSVALLDSDERLMTVGANGKYVRLYQTGSMAHESRFKIGSGAGSIAITPDGTRAVISRSAGAEREILVLPLR
ncbi:MAG: hypothetical protein ACYS0E_09575 [Planctomycetota bacterium]|jgi:hypothetical protein